jgi:signal transduction histidine kinase
MFRLTRFFSFAALLVIIAATVTIAAFNRHVAVENLRLLAESRNEALAKTLSNAMWPRFAGYVAETLYRDPSTFAERAETRVIESRVRALMSNLPVLKVKIYNLAGTTIYSSQESQIGEDHSTNQGFETARLGTSISELTHRNHFDAFEGEKSEVDVLSTYVPIYDNQGHIVAVVEIYSEVTSLVEQMREDGNTLLVVVIVTFALLYIALLLIVRHADRSQVRRHQAILLEQRAQSLQERNRDLEQQIAQRRYAEAELRRARDEAELANRSKTEFLANMSHELRTPLNAIIGFSEIMRDELLGPLGDARYGQYVKDIHGSGAHLLAIINDILDLSKIEAGKHELLEETVELPAVVKSCLMLLGERAQGAGVKLSQRVPDDLRALRGDPRKIKQILLNLLANAVKFTPAGGTVTVTAERKGDGGLSFSVVDTGIGIDPAHFERVLAPFGQVDSGLGRKYEGTGLGLPLARAFAELHGGKLELASAPGEGTRVTIHLPKERVLGREMAA